KNDLDHAMADLNAALRINPEFAAAYRNRSIIYQRRKAYPLAIADSDAEIRINPKEPVAFWRRGVLYDARHELYGAKSDLDHAVSDSTQAVRVAPGASWTDEVAKRIRELSSPGQPPPRVPEQAQPVTPNPDTPGCKICNSPRTPQQAQPVPSSPQPPR